MALLRNARLDVLPVTAAFGCDRAMWRLYTIKFPSARSCKLSLIGCRRSQKLPDRKGGLLRRLMERKKIGRHRLMHRPNRHLEPKTPWPFPAAALDRRAFRRL